MPSLRTLWFALIVAGVGQGLAFADEAADAAAEKIEPAAVNLGREVDFNRDVAPILEANCLACHNSAITESGLNLEEVEAILKGGDRGAALVPEKPEESLLFKVAARAEEPHMPPLPNDVQAAKFTPEQLGVLRQWILEGAKGGGSAASSMVNWQPLPDELKAIYSIALSPWGEIAAVGRANQIFVYDLEAGREMARLVDPNLATVDFNGQPMYPHGAAHRDFVHSLAMNPEGTLLASGDYRVVKFWQRAKNVQKQHVDLPGAATAVAVRADGKLAAIATADNSIQLWNLQDGTIVRALAGHTAAVMGLEFWPSAGELAQARKTVGVTGLGLQKATKAAEDAAHAAQAKPSDQALIDAKTAADAALTVAREKYDASVAKQTALEQTIADQSKLVSSSADQSVRFWNLADGTVSAQINAPSPLNDVSFSKDAAQVATAGADNIVRIWNAADGMQVREIPGHEKPVTSVKFVLPAGEQLVSGSEDGTVRVWNLADGAQVHSLAHGGAVRDVAVRPDGQVIGSAGADNLAKLWQVADAKMVAELRGDVNAQRTVFKATDDQAVAKQLVALAGAGVTQAEKNVAEREEGLKKANEEKPKAETAVEEAKKKKTELDAALDAAKKELEAKADDEALKKKVADAEKAATDQATAVTKAEEAVASAVRAIELADKAVALMKQNLETAKGVKTKADERQTAVDAQLAAAQAAATAAEKPLQAIAFSPDGTKVATTGDDNLLHLWNATTGRAIETLSGPAAALSAAAFVGDQGLLAAGAEPKVTVWDLNAPWQLVAQLGASAENPLDVSASPFKDRVLALAFSPDGKKLATGGGEPSRNGELMLWDVEARTLIREFPDAHSDSVLGVEFSRDGSQLLSGAADKFVKIFNIETGEHVRSFEGHTHHVLDVSWKADSSAIASAGADNVIKVWNVETGEQNRTISGHAKQVTSLQFIGTGDNVISSGGDKTVRLNNSADGKETRSFGGGTDFMYAVAATRDESLVIAGGEDGILRVWNGADGKSMFTFDPPVYESTPGGLAQAE